MFDLRKYRVVFDIWGLLLFLAVMLPNIIWFLMPAPVDLLRKPSVTSVADTVASVFQVIMVAAGCALQNSTCRRPAGRGWRGGIAAAVFLYFTGWAFYYAGITNVLIIMDLCIAPCAAFILFALARRNGIAFVTAIVFMLCHGYYGAVNFVI
ncbi:MAG: hypothetical protein K2O34_10280 [Acetatifactor sp.]|nr:hypothetical protein [Acetatifactor sp.]